MKNPDLKRVVEALLFVASEPVPLARLKELIKDENEGDENISRILKELARGYEEEGKSFSLVRVASGYQLKTKDKYSPWVRKMFQTRRGLYLSRPALETLAIIAYKQPITRVEIEVIRGVNVDGIIKSLFDRELIKIAGQKEVVGRPYLYRTCRKFLEYLGINSLAELPPLEPGGGVPALEKKEEAGPPAEPPEGSVEPAPGPPAGPSEESDAPAPVPSAGPPEESEEPAPELSVASPQEAKNEPDRPA